jgi:hypothetical protein
MALDGNGLIVRNQAGVAFQRDAYIHSTPPKWRGDNGAARKGEKRGKVKEGQWRTTY